MCPQGLDGKLFANSKNSVRLFRITGSDPSVEAASSRPELEDFSRGAIASVACYRRQGVILYCWRDRG